MEQQSCIDLLKLFPKHGDPILEAAQRALDEANELTDLLCAVQANTAKLEAVSSEEEHIHDWIAINQWLEGLSVAQRADMTEHLAIAHKALAVANEQAAERVLIWVVRTWGEDFEQLSTADSPLPSWGQEHTGVMTQIYVQGSKMCACEQGTTPSDLLSTKRTYLLFQCAQSILRWYTHAALIRSHMVNQNLTHLEKSHLHSLQSTFDLLENTKLPEGGSAPIEAVQRIKHWWSQPHMMGMIVKELVAMECEPSERMKACMRQCMEMGPRLNKDTEKLTPTDEELQAILACSTMEFYDDMNLLKRAATNYQNAVMLRKLDIQNQIFGSIVTAAKIEIHLQTRQKDAGAGLSSAFLASAIDAKVRAMEPLHDVVEDALLMAEYEHMKIAAGIVKATETRVVAAVEEELSAAQTGVLQSLPPMCSLNDPGLLTSASKQQIILKNPKAGSPSGF